MTTKWKDARRTLSPEREARIKNRVEAEIGRLPLTELRGMSAMVANPAYAELLIKIPPRVIHTEEENESYTAALFELDRNHDALSPEEKDLADLLTLLIEDFEEKHYQLPKATPLDVISFLMEQHGLKQKDLVDVFGNRGYHPK